MKNSGATLVRGMREVLSGMSGVESYVDNLICVIQQLEKALRNFRKGFKEIN